MTTASIPPDRVALGHLMKVDAVTAKVTMALGEAGLRSILLKGPTFGRWLYDHRLERKYRDTDLLVEEKNQGAAEAVLKREGFEQLQDDVAFDRPAPAHSWYRASDGALVDLHVTLTGIGTSPERFWELVSKDTEKMIVGGTEIEMLGPEARLVHVVLHNSQHGDHMMWTGKDLTAAIERVPRDTWGGALALAHAVGAVSAFAAGLRMDERGRMLAQELGLPHPQDPEVILRAGNPPPLALGLEWMMRQNIPKRVGLAFSKMFPPRSVIESWDSRARGNTVWLVWAYLRRPLWILRHLRTGLRSVQDAKRRAGKAGRKRDGS